MHPGCVLSIASVGRRRCTFHSCGIEGNKPELVIPQNTIPGNVQCSVHDRGFKKVLLTFGLAAYTKLGKS